MSYAFPMHVIQSLGNLRYYIFDLAFIDVLHDQFSYLSALTVLR